MVSEQFRRAEENLKKTGFPIISDEKTVFPLYVSIRNFPIRYQIGIAKIQKFFEGLKEGKIYATQCKVCGVKYFPPRADCPKCLRSEIEWVVLDGEGQLLTYTQVFVKPSSFAHHKDYVVGIAQLKEGVRVLAWVNVDDLKKLKAGMKVRLTTTIREKDGVLTYELIPVA